jgi:alpha-1,4-digalacturonate transport system substrate-binding protein
MGAAYFNEDGLPTVTDEGFERMSEMFVNWHESGVMPMDVWAGATGYAAPNEEFINARAVFYMSGSWQIGQFAEQIGDAFDWEAIPNPCGPAACTGIPGGAAVVAINDTEHPEAVARVLNYLAQEEVASEFYRRTLFLPAHQTVAEEGVDYDTELDQVSTSLNVFGSQVSQLDELAFRFQGYTYNRAIMNATTDRLTQALVGELTLQEALDRAQQDINEALAAEGIDVPEMDES